MRGSVKRTEAGERVIETETRIGQFGPTSESQPVLNFLLAPMFDAADGRFRRVAINALQISDIIMCIILDERCGLHRGEEGRIHFGGVEPRPLDIVERPARLINHTIGHFRSHRCWPFIITACNATSYTQPHKIGSPPDRTWAWEGFSRKNAPKARVFR